MDEQPLCITDDESVRSQRRDDARDTVSFDPLLDESPLDPFGVAAPSRHGGEDTAPKLAVRAREACLASGDAR